MQLTDTIRSILSEKGREVFSVEPHVPVLDAIEEMSRREVGALLVIAEGRLLGIVSERDYARKVILQGKSSRETPVSEIMTRDVVTVTPDHSIDECMQLMTEHRARHLPVLDRSQVVGVVSIGDLVKAIISAHEATIAHLHSYIAGAYPG